MVDLETSGPVVGTHSMTELGAAVGSVRHGMISRFEALLKPVGTAVVAAEQSFARAQKEGRPPEETMKAFADWCQPFQKYNAIFVARPSAYDWPWIVWYARKFLKGNPFGFRVICGLSWDLAKGKKFDIQLTHSPPKDAELLLKYFLEEAHKVGPWEALP